MTVLALAPQQQTQTRRTVDLPALVARTNALLASGVPLTLLLDLGDPAGPRSADRYRQEGGGDAAWLQQPA